MKLHWQILIAIALAVIAGALLEPHHGIGQLTFFALFSFCGTLFLNALKMIVVPLIVSAIISGITSAGSGGGLGRMGVKTIGLFLLSSLLAILVGLALVNLTQPGLVDGRPAGDSLNLSGREELADSLSKVEGRDGSDIAAVFLRLVPTNIIKSAASDDMLGLIVFTFLFAIFALRITPKYAQFLRDFWQGVFEVMMAMTLFVMRFAPIGVFGLVANTVMVTGFAAFVPLAVFFGTVALGLLVHACVTLALLLRFVGRINPLLHYRAMVPALLTAFSTASSSATLPITIECLEKKVGISNRTTSFVLPLGATTNMDGTALYECVAAIFIAQAYGLDLSFGQQFLVVVLALLTSIGVTGIPAASLVAISVILTAIGLPLEGIGLLLVTDRVLDMMRTAVNVFSDSCCAVMVARTEGETGLYQNQTPG